mgnify:CR=1 FL=1
MELNGEDTKATNLLSSNEIAGLKLFLDSEKTQCLRCHNGRYFTNYQFHNIGTILDEDKVPDFGRFYGIRAAMLDEFNCKRS